MPDMNSIKQSMEIRHTMLKESAKVNKDALFNALSAAGIDRLAINFDGEGDSGQLEVPVAYKGEIEVPLPDGNIMLHQVQWNSEQLSTQEASIAHAIEILCYDFLEQEHGGWENNDGACGDFTFRVADRVIDLEFSARYTDTTNYSHTF